MREGGRQNKREGGKGGYQGEKELLFLCLAPPSSLSPSSLLPSVLLAHAPSFSLPSRFSLLARSSPRSSPHLIHVASAVDHLRLVAPSTTSRPGIANAENEKMIPAYPCPPSSTALRSCKAVSVVLLLAQDLTQRMLDKSCTGAMRSRVLVCCCTRTGESGSSRAEVDLPPSRPSLPRFHEPNQPGEKHASAFFGRRRKSEETECGKLSRQPICV